MIRGIKGKVIALMMMLMMTASLIFVFSPAEVNAASTTYKMPTGIKTYEYKSGKWKKTNDRTFKYDSKGNMKNWDGAVLKLAYNGSKLKKVTVETKKNTENHCITTKQYNSKGNVTKITYNYTELMKNVVKYKYNSKGYIKSRTFFFGGDEDFTETYTYRYYTNGMPKQITMTNTYNKEKIIEKFNQKGFLTSSKTYDGKKLTQSFTTSYKMSGDTVTQAVETYTVRKGKKSNYKWKYVYSYGNAKTKDSKQYAAIISMTHDSFLFRAVGNNSAVGWCR